MRHENTRLMGTLASGSKSKSSMEEIAVVLRTFGDEQSTLLDQFERMSFEVQLNQAILRRSFSEPSVVLSKLQAPLPPLVNTKPMVKAKAKQEVRQGRRGSAFSKALKKLLKAFLVKKGGNNNNNNNVGSGTKEVRDPRNPKYFKAFSRSLRL